MICRTVELTGYAGVRPVFVSVPLVPQLLDGKKWTLPGDAKPPEGDTELRRYRARGPTLRTLVRTIIQSEMASGTNPDDGHR